MIDAPQLVDGSVKIQDLLAWLDQVIDASSTPERQAIFIEMRNAVQAWTVQKCCGNCHFLTRILSVEPCLSCDSTMHPRLYRETFEKHPEKLFDHWMPIVFVPKEKWEPKSRPCDCLESSVCKHGFSLDPTLSSFERRLLRKQGAEKRRKAFLMNYGIV